jgi:hypothetical protein
MSWWARTLAFLFAAGWIALAGAFIWALWSDGVEYVDFGNLELRFDFEGDDGEKILATVVAAAIGLTALLFILGVVFGLGGRKRYHQMLRADGTQLLVDTDIVSQRMAEAARAVPGVRRASASARPASNNEVQARLDLEVYGNADPAGTAQQASQAAVEALQQHFETRPSGGLKTQVRQVGKAGPAAAAEPVSDEGTKPTEVAAEEPVTAESEPPGQTEGEAVETGPEPPVAEEAPVREGAEEESEP